jgi:choline dehydrogenase-like flavoprotein
MMTIARGLVLAILASLLSTASLAKAPASALSDQQIAEQLIQQSISRYPGHCPCPYNSTANGRACGKRSAYSRPGGQAPLCYAEDVTPDMIKRYRQHG